MKSRSTEDTAPYAADCVASAQVNAPRLLASGVLFTVLLVAMTFIEAPIARQALRTYVAGVPQSTLSIVGSAANGGRVIIADSTLGCPRQQQDSHGVHSAWPG